MSKKLTDLILQTEPNKQFSAHLETVSEAIERMGKAIEGLAAPNLFAALHFPTSAYARQMRLLQEQELYPPKEFKLISPLDFTNVVIEWTIENPERWPYESLVDWGKRLEDAGLFDNYETRLMYGVECWRAVLHSPIWYAGEAWYWLRYDAWELVRELWTNRNDG